MLIRPAETSDIQSIASIHIESWLSCYTGVLSETYLRENLEDERLAAWQKQVTWPSVQQHIFVLEDDDRVVGFVCLHLDNDPDLGSYVDNLHIAISHQSKGFGKQLLATAARLADMHSYHKGLYLQVAAHNTKAQAFYTKLGGQKVNESNWNAPDGTVVPTLTFYWSDVKNLSDGPRHSKN